MVRRAIYNAISFVERRRSTHLPLYHATFARVPAAVDRDIHNVTPDIVFSQVEWLSRTHRFVSIDTWFDAPHVRGLACLTFDDAYACIFETVVPGLIKRGIPCTVFVNGCTLHGRRLWRDDIRVLQTRGLVVPFLDDLEQRTGTRDGLTEENFYRHSKSAAVNNRRLAEALQAFLERHPDTAEQAPPSYCVETPAQLVDDPLVTYGNHTYHHYLLSSLTVEEQTDEIVRNRDILAAAAPRTCGALAVPFGGNGTYNAATVEAARAAGYHGLLLTGRGPQFGRSSVHGMPCGFRYLAPVAPDDMATHTGRMLVGHWKRQLIGRSRT